MTLTLSIPENLYDIKLLWYQRFLENESKYEYVLNKRRALIEQCCGIDSLGLIEMTQTDSDYLYNKIEPILNTRDECRIVDSFEAFGTKFNLIDFNIIKLKEYRILEDNLLDIKNIHKVINILYRDDSNKYNPEYDELFRQLPLNVVYGLLNYFTDIFNTIMSEITGEYLPINTDMLLLTGDSNKDFVRIILQYLKNK